MVHQSVIEARLTKIGFKKTWLCRPEIRQLSNLLMDNEDIVHCVSGRYHGGFAILVATQQRILLIDKKPLYLTVEDIRYDMIAEVDINARLFDASVTIFTVNKQLVFTSIRQHPLRSLTAFLQQRVMEIRQYHRQDSPVAAIQPQPSPAWLQPAPSPAPQVHSYSYLADQPQSYTPSPHLPHIVGSTAVHNSYIPHANPFVRGSLMVRRRG